MDIVTIVENINRSGQLDKLCKRASRAHWRDLRQEINLILLSHPSPRKIVGMYRKGDLAFWLRAVIRNQAQTPRGTFYRNYILIPRKQDAINDETISAIGERL